MVLAVDDDPLVLTNTLAMLEDLGHTAHGASSGIAALEVLRQENPIDVVITDHVMPLMTGLQLANKIKAEWPKLPVILATGFAEIASGSFEFPRLSKPFSQTELAETLKKIQPMAGKAHVLKFAGASPKT